MKKIYLLAILLLLKTEESLASGPLNNALSPMISQTRSFQETSGFSEASRTTLSDTIASVVRVFLGLLGIIFVVLIIWSGFNWMTAGGNEDQLAKAKKTITRAIIGLIITLSAYAITYFVFNALGDAT
ncbi:hypothetical protein C0584_06225 [Candidatus Parcubacteria bacterium]|nr:MAG: hypothetical protein C0584_06225 [Candidatus Parcubacteria bacterium]